MLDKLRKAWNTLFKEIPVLETYPDSVWAFAGTTRSTLTQLLGRNAVNDPYASHSWVRGAIESVALNISGTPLMWKNSTGKAADLTRGPVKQWQILFEKPNDLMGQQQLFEATMVFLLHYGECMWVLDRDNPTDIPRTIDPYNGKIFDTIKNAGGHIVGWKVEHVKENGQKEEVLFNTWEVCFFKLFNPYDRLRGLSPMHAAQLGIDQDVLASQYNKAFFTNSAMPGGVIEIEESLTDEQFNRLKNQYQENHQGASKAHTLAILEGGATYKQLMVSQKDMEFLNQKKWNRDEILACFKVPKLELGIWDEVNFAVAKVQAREFWVKSLIPKIKLLEYVMWTQLFSMTSTGNVFADFDLSRIEALQGDLNEKVDMAFKLWQMGYPINDLNHRFTLGLPEKKWGNTPYVMNNVFQVDEKTGEIKMPVPPPLPPGSETPKPKQNPDTQKYLQASSEPSTLDDVDEIVRRMLETTS